MGETCVDSLSIKDLTELIDSKNARESQQQRTKRVLETKLTYRSIQGSEELKKAISTIYNDDDSENSNPIEPANIIVTNGGTGGNVLLLYNLVKPGDHVIVVDPSYQQLSSVANVFSNGDSTKFPLNFEVGYSPKWKFYRV